MNNLLITLVAGVTVIGGVTAAVLDSIPVLTDALTGAGVGALVGSVLSYRLERRADRRGEVPTMEPRWLTVRWSCAGALLGSAAHIPVAIL
jgi:hypothetical protein